MQNKNYIMSFPNSKIITENVVNIIGLLQEFVNNDYSSWSWDFKHYSARDNIYYNIHEITLFV